MRKSSSVLTVLVIIALLGLGIAAFFLGWVHLSVPPGSYGVMRTKTHGIYPELIQDGKFLWVWYKLIPTNAVISVYSPNKVERPFSISGALLSADLYRRFASLDMDFSYELDGSFTFRIDPESLPALTESRGIGGQDDLEKLEASTAAEIESFIGRCLDEYRKEPETLLDAGFPDRLKQEISAAFPGIGGFEITLNIVKFPDFALYDSLRLLYQDYLDRQRQLLTEDIREAALRNVTTQLRLDELARYGELLTKYPILLQYLGMENAGSR
ncbi:MAG: hypothetical protein LBF77_04375 [Spirochaetaceae bacterium]|jgi:hypothetical protein|nr:hypothetical protein [Spirochaetaceae bacterium]